MRRFHSLSQMMIASTLLAAFLALPVSAAEVTPAWALDFQAPVKWQRVTSLGDLIVSTPNGLYGVDPANGAVLWSQADLANLQGIGFEEIPGAPLFMIDDGSDDPRVMVLNALDGTVVFDSRKAGLVEIQGRYVMPRTGGLLVVGFEAGNFNTQVFMYDMASGKQRWHSEFLSQGMNKMMKLLIAAAQVSMNATPVHTEPVELADGSFLLAAMGAVHRIDAATGKVLWKADAGNAQVLHLTDKRPAVVYVGSEEGDDSTPYYSGYQALSLDTGKPVWKKPQRIRGALNPLIVSADQGLVVSERTEGSGKIRLLDYDSGKSLWGKKGKGIKVKGGIVDYDFSNAGLVVTTGYDSAWNDKGTEYLLYVLDVNAGALRFEDPLKVKGRMLRTELLQQGLLYVTTHEVNVFSPQNGRLVHEPVVRGKKPIVTSWNGNYLYAFNTAEGLLYRLDRRTAELVRLSMARAELQGKDNPMALDVRANEIVLTGHQNVIGFSADGQIRFSAYHPAPRRHKLVQALMWAQAVRATMASVDTGVAGAAFAAASSETDERSIERQLTTELGKGFTQMSEGYMGLAGDYAREARRRFQASATARDFVFMMVQQDKQLSLAQVSKGTGQIVALINMGSDKEPSYQVDDVGDRIFYRQAPSVIAAYSFATSPLMTQSR